MHDCVVLFDVDNTLLDNDRVTQDLRDFLTREVGAKQAEEYFSIFGELRQELGYADYLGALQRFRLQHPHEAAVLKASSWLVDYPFAERVFPKAVEVIKHLAALGPTVILTDGDVVFQPRKIERSGLAQAVEDRVLVYVHKEQELGDVERRFPARRYVLVDDKLRILAAVRDVWGARLTAVFPRQGHYAHDPRMLAEYPEDEVADVAVDRIGELLTVPLAALAPAGDGAGRSAAGGQDAAAHLAQGDVAG
jgi:hypothetical protein